MSCKDKAAEACPLQLPTIGHRQKAARPLTPGFWKQGLRTMAWTFLAGKLKQVRKQTSPTIEVKHLELYHSVRVCVLKKQSARRYHKVPLGDGITGFYMPPAVYFFPK